MAVEAIVTSEVTRIPEIVVLRLDFPEEFSETGDTVGLGKKLVEGYRNADGNSIPFCIVVIDAETAGPFLIRALGELYRTVVTGKQGLGHLICINLPEDCVEDLVQSGFPDLPGFSRFDTLEKLIDVLAIMTS